MANPAAVPLAAHALFHTHDLDEARERVASVFCPHRLDRIGKGAFDACHHHLRGERLSLNYIAYGTKTLIAPGELRDFYLVQVPLSGAAAIRNGADTYVSDPARAAVLNPHHATTMIWDEDCRQVLLQIDRQALNAHLAGLIAGRPDRPLTFTGSFDLTSQRGAALKALLLYLVSEADAGRPVLRPGSLLGRQIESTLMTGLLEAHRHNFSDALSHSRGPAPLPRMVRQAEEYILAHVDQPIAIEDVAQAVGVSARTLQLAFRRFRDTTPMAFLRDARLDRADADLRAALPGSSVTEIATRWGFGHFGRFAGIYRARFGCTPRQTLQDALADRFVS
ncbi:AraC family transcriptional regulator [Pararhodobacter aggregans]|uniref:AraC family transcriptional regulator n=1 Tax=Pararhodobacter aggregans TaxID=404875 RepID=A0A2T7UKC3_9RHOB|nr:AraC family transcriptional regulator [Pararhodobacter aggregans]PTX03208.1 AraC family transcriptional regulator [Pararhodobacter aggregans]PVE45113.1 AraC family transcriptional regulator [Pararhodobacter aggregans]